MLNDKIRFKANLKQNWKQYYGEQESRVNAKQQENIYHTLLTRKKPERVTLSNSTSYMRNTYAYVFVVKCIFILFFKLFPVACMLSLESLKRKLREEWRKIAFFCHFTCPWNSGMHSLVKVKLFLTARRHCLAVYKAIFLLFFSFFESVKSLDIWLTVSSAVDCLVLFLVIWL